MTYLVLRFQSNQLISADRSIDYLLDMVQLQSQVRHAELAGASAAIVYDDVYEALIIMSKPWEHPEPGIPAVFVSQKAGIIMKKLVTPGLTRVRIMPVSVSYLPFWVGGGGRGGGGAGRACERTLGCTVLFDYFIVYLFIGARDNVLNSTILGEWQEGRREEMERSGET